MDANGIEFFNHVVEKSGARRLTEDEFLDMVVNPTSLYHGRFDVGDESDQWAASGDCVFLYDAPSGKTWAYFLFDRAMVATIVDSVQLADR